MKMEINVNKISTKCWKLKYTFCCSAAFGEGDDGDSDDTIDELNTSL